MPKQKQQLTVSWSGGKDSAFALDHILRSGEYEVAGLHVVISNETRRVGMHGIRETLIQQQAASLGLPLTTLYLDASESRDAYEALMRGYYLSCRDNGLDGVLFGDIFLQDLRSFREDLLTATGLIGVFPLWQKNTYDLIRDFVQRGFKTMVCAADAKFFSKGVAGRTIDRDFISSLPGGVDACGENGEYHTFVYDGPIFNKPIHFTTGGTEEKTYSYQKLEVDGARETVEDLFYFKELFPVH